MCVYCVHTYGNQMPEIKIKKYKLVTLLYKNKINQNDLYKYAKTKKTEKDET